MGLRDLSIGPSYETLEGADPVQEFYIPALSQSVRYDRSVGFFSSASLALAARGIAGLIKNEGKMRLVVSPHLSKRDIEVIRAAGDKCDEAVEKIMLDAMADVETLADEIERDHVRALGWMLTSGYLEMRIALVTDDKGDVIQDQLFHQKVGVMRDEKGAALSFSGSINETASGWLYNSEEFKVFKSWDPGQRDFYESDARKFEELWGNERSRVRTFAPKGSLCDFLIAQGDDFDIEFNSLDAIRGVRKPRGISLFSYQREAMEKWKACGGRLLFEMATGTGKTRTALACVQHLLETKDALVCVIATPQTTLSRQWSRELESLGLKFDCKVFADSSECQSREWAAKIRSKISRIAIGRSKSLVVFTTHKSAANPLFLDAMSRIGESVATCLVGDEVHGMGSREYVRALSDRYDYRIGLSATPSRWFDDAGTEAIVRYFGGESFEFAIRDAQETVNPLTGEPFLCPYKYELVQVSLTDDESEEYERLSELISKYCHSDDPESKEKTKRLLMKRANVKKNAAKKLGAFERLLGEIDPNNMIVFTSPEHIDEVEGLLAKKRIAAHRFTKDQGTRPRCEFDGLSERDYLIRALREGALQALVAIKCLDEGIDIPEARTAVLLSSGTNPREYVQRIGRVIRRAPDKELAHIYDFVVVPDWYRIERYGDIDLERKLFDQELVRIEDMMANAVNRTDLLIQAMELRGRAYGN